MSIKVGNKPVHHVYVGTKQVRAIYVGSTKIWPNVVRVESGNDYGAWSYSDPYRSRTVTPWSYDVYVDGSTSARRYGTPWTQTETATSSVEWDGYTYWNGSCGSNYYYVDYKKVYTRYAYSDVTRYSDYYNGDSRSRRIDGYCGWVRDWRTTRDWYNNGQLCNAAGTVNAWDCDGYNKVQYYRQQQDQSYCYPDGTGSTNTRSNYRVGSRAVYQKVDGACSWVRSAVVVSDWANTGNLCNSAGTVGAYDCDGTYSVQYYQQSRVLEDRYPDGSGATNRRTEYRVGGQASRVQVDGQCGYVARQVRYYISDVLYTEFGGEISDDRYDDPQYPVEVNLYVGPSDSSEVTGGNWEITFRVRERITQGNTLISDEYVSFNSSDGYGIGINLDILNTSPQGSVTADARNGRVNMRFRTMMNNDYVSASVTVVNLPDGHDDLLVEAGVDFGLIN